MVQRNPLSQIPNYSLTPIRKRFHAALPPNAPVLVLDAEGSIRSLTEQARRLLEYGPEQDVEPCFFSHVHGRNLYQVMRDTADMVCRGKARASWLLRLRTGQGRWRWYKATAANRLNTSDPAITVQLRDLRDW